MQIRSWVVDVGIGAAFLMVAGGVMMLLFAISHEPRPTTPGFYERMDSIEAKLDSLTSEVKGIRTYLEGLTAEVEHEISFFNPRADSHRLAELFVAVGIRQGVSPRLLTKIARVESHYRVGALGALDDSGLLQVRTSIWYNFVRRKCGTWNVGDARAEICAGAVVVRFLLDKCTGDTRCALSRYNSGRPASAAGRRYARAVIGD